MKILSLAAFAVIFLAVFFALNQYNLVYMENRLDREAFVVGNTVLSSCIAENYTGYPIKGLLSDERIKNIFSSYRYENIDCLNFYKGIYIEIYNETPTNPNYLIYGFGNTTGVCTNFIPNPPIPCIKSSTTYTSSFPAALNRTDRIIPVNVTIYVGA